jgi:protoporphyrinogen IX oxidase
MIWLKMLHIAAISLWSGMLICLPALYVQRAYLEDTNTLHGLQDLVRFIYVKLLSPAAFVAVGSGIALIFLRGAFETWFSVKLGLVGAMTVVHVLTGLVIIKLFDEGQVYPAWRFVAVTGVTVLIVSLVLLVVLAKPDIPNLLPEEASQPGGLRVLVNDLIDLLR